ncbi:MAG: SRPBCC family protein [Bradymonadaceae bacterium]|nr:SRPBCC family protein [Lujinxingiaceae bacterium]
MNKSLLPATLAIVACLLPATVPAQSNDALSKGEISVDIVDVQGSEVPKVIVKGVIDAPPAKVWRIISDCNHYAKRMPRIKASKQLEKKGDTVICEVTVGLPFPMSDLRATTTAKHVEGPTVWSRHWTLIEGDYEINNGSWEISAFAGDPNRSFAVYTVHAVPNTAVPAWMRRRAQESSMPDIIRRIREEVKKLP